MESYCVFLMGNFIPLPAFEEAYGVPSRTTDSGKIIEASWQSALQMGGPVGAIMGVMLAGPLTSRIGYRWATITGLMLLNCFIFVMYFAKSLPIFFVSQLLEGIPWGIFIANAPAYCSEITPIQLRAPATQMLQMFWAIGAIIVGGVTYYYNPLNTETAFRYSFSFQLPPSATKLTKYTGSLSHFNGCSLPHLLFCSTLLPKALGGWSARAASRRQRSRSFVWDARRGSMLVRPSP